MCTRFYAEASPELRPYFEEMIRSPLADRMRNILGKPINAEGEFRPADIAAVIAPASNGNKTVFPMVWGYHVSGISHPLVNCRMETAKGKPLWKESWERHRCIIPASYYFEWEHFTRPDGKVKTGDKYAIQPKDSPVTYLAGLYRIEEERGLKYPVFAVLTREPSEEIRFIHDRMPMILPEQVIDDWIRPEGIPDDVAKATITEMLFEKAD